MDAKITKVRLSRMLSYDWIKIVGFGILAIVVWSLIFTMTATRITTAQKFTVMNYVGSSQGEKFNATYNESLSKGVLSHEVLELGNYDLSMSPDYLTTMLESYMAVDDGDVIFASDVLQEGSAYVDADGKEQQASYLDTFLMGYSYRLFDLSLENENGFFRSMEKYLSTYYIGDIFYPTPELNKDKVKADFLARIERTGDKRYKTDAEIQEGYLGEINRIIKYRDALIEFYGHLKAGRVSLTQKSFSVKNSAGQTYKIEGTYSINLCPDETKMEKLKDVVCYAKTEVDENGVQKTVLSAQDMNISIFDMPSTENGFEYEALLYINHIIRCGRTTEAANN